MIYVIADMHLNHANIIRYCSRPFSSVHEMSMALVRNWNSVVTEEDTVFHCGDFCSGEPLRWAELLKGRIEFIRGNHDHQLDELCEVRGSVTLVHNGEWFKLCHYPPQAPGQFWTIHGHSHNSDPNYPLVSPVFKSMNVGCEMINYTPIALDELLKIRDTVTGV